MGPDDLPCSRNARSRRSFSPHPRRGNEQAWREHTYRSMRAVKNDLPPPLGKVKNQEGLVRRAQSRVDQATLGNVMGVERTRAVEDQSRLIPG
jgi:hypothetical protein